MLGLERIKTLAAEIKDNPLLKIIEYLLTRTDMNDKYLNEEKSLKQMVEFIKEEAHKKAVNGVAMIEDEVVYGWAIHYFDESNEQLGLNKKEKNEEKREEPISKLPKELKSVVSEPAKKEVKPEGPLQLNIFDVLG